MDRKEFFSLLGATPFAVKSLINSPAKDSEFHEANLVTKLRTQGTRREGCDSILIQTPKVFNGNAIVSVFGEGQFSRSITETKTILPIKSIPIGKQYRVEIKTTDAVWTQENLEQIVITENNKKHTTKFNYDFYYTPTGRKNKTIT